MLGSLLVLAAVVTIPPPAESEASRPAVTAIAGLGNPDWLHAGVHGRLGALGATLTLGTIGLAHGLTAAGRWFLPTPVLGAYAEAGASVIRLAPISDQTPGDLFPLGFVALGWQHRAERWLVDVALGPPPTLLGGPSIPPLAALNAMALPRCRLAVGYGF